MNLIYLMVQMISLLILLKEGTNMAKYDIITKENFSAKEIAGFLDYTLLMPYYSEEDVDVFIDNAIEYGINTCYVNSVNVAYAAKLLRGHSNITLGSSIAYPFGTMVPEIKTAEAKRAIQDGANIFDCVINIGAVKIADWDTVKKDIAAVARVAYKYQVEAKSILETCYLTDEEKVKVALIAKEEGMEFVKTSSGFGKGGATVHDVELLKKTVGSGMGVKASGSIGSYDLCVDLIHAGAHRLGSKMSIEIIKEAIQKGK